MQNATLRNTIATILNVASFVLGVSIGLRIFLKALAVSSAVPIVSFIYSLSQFFINPFRGIFPDQRLGNGGFLDVTAFIALIAYMILIYLLFALMNSVTTIREKHETVDTVHRHV